MQYLLLENGIQCSQTDREHSPFQEYGISSLTRQGVSGTTSPIPQGQTTKQMALQRCTMSLL